MSRCVMSIEVFKETPCSAIVTVYAGTRRVDRVVVIPGDCLDLDLDDGMAATIGPMPQDEEDQAEAMALQDELARIEALEVAG